MRKVFALLPFLWLAVPAIAGTVDVTYTFTDYNLTPQSVKRVTQQVLTPFADYNGAILTASPVVQVTGGAGSATFSNTVSGYSYRVTLDTPYGSTVRTSGFPSTLSGPVNGRDWLGEIRGMNFYYLYPNFTNALPLSTISTNGGSQGQVVTWNAGSVIWSNSAAGGSSNAVTNNNVPAFIQRGAMTVSNALSVSSNLVVTGTINTGNGSESIHASGLVVSDSGFNSSGFSVDTAGNAVFASGGIHLTDFGGVDFTGVLSGNLGGGTNLQGSGTALNNLDYAHITTPTTNGVYDVTMGFMKGATTTFDENGVVIDISAYNGTWFVHQTSPVLVMTNSVLPAGYWFWGTNNFQEGAPTFTFSTNLADAGGTHIWAFVDPPNGLGTNGDVVGLSTTWISGNGGSTLSDNLFQFATNQLITYPQRIITTPSDLAVLTNDIVATSNALKFGAGAYLTNTMPPAGFNDYALPTPMMKWSTYNVSQSSGWFSEADITNSARALILNGYYASGYTWISIDDSWQAAARDGSGDLQPNATMFPRGMAATITDLHNLGFKVQIYTSYSTNNNGATCFGLPGTVPGNVQRDINKFASWGVDGIFVDSCSQANPSTAALVPGQYIEAQLFASAIQRVEPHRSMVLELGMSDRNTGLGPNSFTPPIWGMEQVVNVLNFFGNADFTYENHVSGRPDLSLSNIVSSASTVTNAPWFFKPGHSAFLGRIPTSPVNVVEQQQAVTTEAMCSSSIIIGFTNANPSSKIYLTNAEVIAIDQNAGVHAPVVVENARYRQIWNKQLGNFGSGSNAICIWNWDTNSAATNIVVPWSWLGISSNTYVTVRDVWAQTNCGTWSGFYSNTIPATNLLLLIFVQAAPFPLGTNALSTWPKFASTPGGGSMQNSNGTYYLLTSLPGSTAWAATNKIAP
jgi:hypothetical protein